MRSTVFLAWIATTPLVKRSFLALEFSLELCLKMKISTVVFCSLFLPWLYVRSYITDKVVSMFLFSDFMH